MEKKRRERNRRKDDREREKERRGRERNLKEENDERERNELIRKDKKINWEQWKEQRRTKDKWKKIIVRRQCEIRKSREK